GRKKTSIPHFSLPELTLATQACRSSQEHWTPEQQTAIDHFSGREFFTLSGCMMMMRGCDSVASLLPAKQGDICIGG
ncbi:hypothetical protein O5154_29215, partial [Escherichia coli]|nr:hypothetical protein [Escherichia coli]